jgi:hypothetical protein
MTAGVNGERRVTLRSSPSVGRRGSAARVLCAVVVGASMAVGCGRADDGLAEARRAALEAGEQTDALEARVDELAGALESAERELDASARDREQLAGRVKRAAQRLRGSLERVRASVDEAHASSSSASSEAASALARAEEVARSLAVLENRYDYHLGNYHGGG